MAFRTKVSHYYVLESLSPAFSILTLKTTFNLQLKIPTLVHCVHTSEMYKIPIGFSGLKVLGQGQTACCLHDILQTFV